MDARVPSDSTLRQLLVQLETARRKLVETGTRNRLIHVNRKSTRSNVINIINERSEDVFRILKKDGRKMKFWATGTDKKSVEVKANGEEGEQFVLLEQIDELDDEPDEVRYTDDRLETKLGPDGQQKRLLKMFRDAKTAEEEQGINILYLALGFLRWFDDNSSDVERQAPLILLPVDLVRNQRTSTYDLVIRDDEIVTNLPLREKLERDFGLQLPEIEDADGEDWAPSGYFNAIEEAISSRDRWSLDRDGMQLGFFSFAKLLMLRDLDPDNWPTGGLLNSSLLSSILNSTFEGDSPIFDDDDNLDEKLDPAEMFHVLDADRSQAIAIEEVRKGRNLVVQGPPGTGKSQTITNIIAAAVHDGKKVLFVAEKMAALSVVHNRLKKTGLEHVALELHSKAANKRRVLEELGRTLNEGVAIAGAQDNPDAVRIPRDKLNAIVKLLHSPVQGSQLTSFQAMAVMSAMKGKGVPAPSMDGQNLLALPEERIEALCSDIETLGELLATDRTNADNPFRGTVNLDLQPLDLERLANEAKPISELARKLSSHAEKPRVALGIEENSMVGIELACTVLKVVAKAPEHAAEMVPTIFDAASNAAFSSALDCALEWGVAKRNSPFVEAALSVPVGEARIALSSGVGSFLRRLGPRYRSASKSLATLITSELPRRVEDRVALIDRLIEFQNLNQRFQQSQTALQRQLGSLWSGETTDFEAVRSAVEFVREFRKLVPNAPANTLSDLVADRAKTASLEKQISQFTKQLQRDLATAMERLKLDTSAGFDVERIEGADISDIAERFEKLAAEQHRYDGWRRYCELRFALSDLRLDQLIRKWSMER